MDACITPPELKERLTAFPPPTVVDVRRQPAFDAEPETIPGAIRHPPDAIGRWAANIDIWRAAVVYCVHGHEVSRNAAATLRSFGLDAHFLAGGLAGWREVGHATTTYRNPTRWVT